jgi:hypothetical protein
MAMRFGGIWKAGIGTASPDRAAMERIKAWTREVLTLPDAAAISVNEIVCADPGCPGTETIVLVMVPGQRTKAYKVTAPLADVTRDALAQALSSAPPAA